MATVVVPPETKGGLKSLWNTATSTTSSTSTNPISRSAAVVTTHSGGYSHTRWNSQAGIEPISYQQKQTVMGVQADQDDVMIQSRNGSTSPSRIRPIRAVMPSLRETGVFGLSCQENNEEEEKEEECTRITRKDNEVIGNEKIGNRRDDPQKDIPTMKCLSKNDLNFVSVKSRLKQWNNVVMMEPPPQVKVSNKPEGVSAHPNVHFHGGSGILRKGGGKIMSTKIKTASLAVPVSTETKLGVQRPKHPSILTKATSLVMQNVEKEIREEKEKEKQPIPSEQSYQQQPLQQQQLQKQQKHLDSLEVPGRGTKNPTKSFIKERALVFGATVGCSAQSKGDCEDQSDHCNNGAITIQNDRLTKQEYPNSGTNFRNLNGDGKRISSHNHVDNCDKDEKLDGCHHHNDKNVTNLHGKWKTSSDDCQKKDNIDNFIPKANDCHGLETSVATVGVRDIRSLFESLPEKGLSTTNLPLKRTSNSNVRSRTDAAHTTFNRDESTSKKQWNLTRNECVKSNRENEIVVMETKNEPKTSILRGDQPKNALHHKNVEPCTVGAAQPSSLEEALISVPEPKVYDNAVMNVPSTSVSKIGNLPSVEDIDEVENFTNTRDISASSGFNMLRSKFESISNSQGTTLSSQNDSIGRNKASDLSNPGAKRIHHKLSRGIKDTHVLKTNKKNAPLHPTVKESIQIGYANRSAFENIRNRFNGEINSSKSPDHNRPDNSLVQFVNNQRILKQSSIIRDSSIQSLPQSQLFCDQKRRSACEVHRKSAFNVYNASIVKSSTPKDRGSDAMPKNDDSNLSPPNDIPWKHIEPNDIPWTDRELLEERERSFSRQKVDMSFSYGAEYLDYSYEDDDCDGVTLCPTASDVSSLSVPSCLRSVDASSETSYASRTSDEDTGAMESMSEKQSTTLGPSEASSSQTSEAAAPLIHSTLGAMSMRFASSSDTTGTFSYNGAQFNALLGALPPPIDGEESDDNSDDLVFQQKNKKCYNYENNKQFEDELKLQSGPEWKNDFFAVDSVKSLPTADSADVSDWVPFPTDSSGKDSLCQTTIKRQVDNLKETKVFLSVERLARNSSKYFSVKPSSYPTQEARLTSPFVSQSSVHAPLPRRVESIQSDTENRVPKVSNDIRSTTEPKLGTGAYRRFDIHRVRAFQQARRNKSFAPT